jgi:hypothetical protein
MILSEAESCPDRRIGDVAKPEESPVECSGQTAVAVTPKSTK